MFVCVFSWWWRSFTHSSLVIAFGALKEQWLMLHCSDSPFISVVLLLKRSWIKHFRCGINYYPTVATVYDWHCKLFSKVAIRRNKIFVLFFSSWEEMVILVWHVILRHIHKLAKVCWALAFMEYSYRMSIHRLSNSQGSYRIKINNFQMNKTMSLKVVEVTSWYAKRWWYCCRAVLHYIDSTRSGETPKL